MESIFTQIVCSVPVDGKTHKGRMFVSALKEIWDFDRCTRILIEKVGVDAFVGAIVPLIPPTTMNYCNDEQYRTQWRHSIWQAAWNAWQETKAGRQNWVTNQTV